MNAISDLTDEEIRQRLSGEALRGPRMFRGSPLAPLTRNLRGLFWSLSEQFDVPAYLDALAACVLLGAHGDTDEELLKRRAELLKATADRETYRAKVALFQDGLSDDEENQLRSMCEEIFGLVKAAEVSIVSTEKKSSESPEDLSQTTTQSPSSASPESSPEATSSN